MIKGIVFDLDGVLVDAVSIHFEAFNSALKLFGYEVPPLIHSLHYNGLPTSSKLELLTQSHQLPRGLHGFINEMKQKFTRELLIQKIEPKQELIDTLKMLKAKGYKLGVASNCTRNTVSLVLKKLSISDLFDIALSKDDVTFPKPSEEIYIKAQSLLGIKPDETLIIEDSPVGLIAAKKASPHVIAIKSPLELSQSLINEKIKDAQSDFYRDPRTIEIVIPMAGSGSRFFQAGFKDPKPLIKIFNRTMIDWVVSNLTSRNFRTRFTFIVNQTHLTKYALHHYLSELSPGSRVVSVPEKTEGAACTVLLALDQLPQASPLVIANSDQWVDHPFDYFLDHSLSSNKDGMIMTFTDEDPKWSFAKTDVSGQVTEVAEKRPISNQATVGIYFFKEVGFFKSAAMQMIREDKRVNQEFYVCPVYNELIKEKKTIGVYKIEKEEMHGLGTPQDLESFISLKDKSGDSIRNLRFG